MSWFSRLERISEKFIEGMFKTKFAGPLQPVEMARALVKEMGEHRRVSVAHTYAPNHFQVSVSKSDWEVLEPVQDSMKEEMRQYLKMKAREKKFVLVQDPELDFIPDDTVGPGEYKITSKFSLRPEGDTSWESGQTGIFAPVRETFDKESRLKPEIENTQVFSLKNTGFQAVEPVPLPRAELVIKSGDSQGMKIRLGKGVSNLGRRETNEIFLNDPNVSRVHAQVELIKGEYILTDLGSLNGTYLNGKRVHRTHLKPGDRIKVGKTELDFRMV